MALKGRDTLPRAPKSTAPPAPSPSSDAPTPRSQKDIRAASPVVLASQSLHSAGPGGGGIPWIPAPGEVGVRVRMYRVGFGDFFLITCLNDAGTPLHMIIDCGVFRGARHTATQTETGDIHSIEAAITDMVQTTGGKVALIVVTHRHADHIAGFARCAEKFKTLIVGGVWMPIWESEYEPTAVKFQAELTRTAYSLRQHFVSLDDSATEGENTARKYMENATGEAAPAGASAMGAAAAGSNAVALELLKHGFTGVTPEYYTGGDRAKLPQSLVNAGMTCKILGPPPVADADLMKLMDLQKNVGQYLTDSDGKAEGAFQPFGTEWEIDPAIAPTRGESEFYTPESFREWVEGPPRKSWQPVTVEEATRARRTMETGLQKLQPTAALIAAKQLNEFINNQSLVVLFTFKGKNLLFVGDAQAGNWEHWLFGADVPDKTAKNTIFPDSRQILMNLDFYKVGHHGSGNATPKAAIDMMGTQGHKFVSMCSTQADVYGNEDPHDPTKGTEVPRTPLMTRLASESALVRSNQIAITVDGKKIPAQMPMPLPVAPPGTRFEEGPLWVDCYL